MRILIVSHHIGGNASGIVAERFAAEMAKYNEVDLCTYDYRPCSNIEYRNLKQLKYPLCHQGLYRRYKKLGMILFHTDIIDELKKKKTVLSGRQYDIVLGICYGNSFFGVIAGLFASTYYKCKMACYLLDPIPAPIGWSKDNIYRRRLQSFITKKLSRADYIASSNPQMLAYQMRLFDFPVALGSETIYTPCNYDRVRNIPYKPNGNIFSFVYTGNIYGLRSARHIVKAFGLLASEYDNVELIFIGNADLDDCDMEPFDFSFQTRIRIIPYASDLMAYYEIAGAFIDIDAELPGDVFLSSKIVNYLTINRPIICETGQGSPSRLLFGNIPSIIQCDHNPEEIYHAMKEVFHAEQRYDFQDRMAVIRKLCVANQARLLHESLQRLTDSK